MRLTPVVFALCVGLAHGQELRPDLRAHNPPECSVFADMALVAKALAEHKVTQAKRMPIMDAIYAPEDERIARIMARLVGEAESGQGTPREWAKALGEHCMRSQGRLPWGVRM